MSLIWHWHHPLLSTIITHIYYLLMCELTLAHLYHICACYSDIYHSLDIHVHCMHVSKFIMQKES